MVSERFEPVLSSEADSSRFPELSRLAFESGVEFDGASGFTGTTGCVCCAVLPFATEFVGVREAFPGAGICGVCDGVGPFAFAAAPPVAEGAGGEGCGFVLGTEFGPVLFARGPLCGMLVVGSGS